LPANSGYVINDVPANSGYIINDLPSKQWPYNETFAMQTVVTSTNFHYLTPTALAFQLS
jgi:hypothetical protein